MSPQTGAAPSGERRRREASGVEYEEGYPLPSRLGGLGSFVSSLRGVLTEPRPRTHFGVFEGHRTLLFAIMC